MPAAFSPRQQGNVLQFKDGSKIIQKFLAETAETRLRSKILNLNVNKICYTMILFFRVHVCVGHSM